MSEDNKNKLTSVGGGLAQGVSAGLSGQEVSFKAVLKSVGGTRGVLETLLPSLLYIVVFVITDSVEKSVIAPAALVIIIIILRLLQRQTLVTALSGVLGVAIAVATTLFTGKAEDFFLPGFWINGAWAFALSVSLIVRWPLLGFLVGGLTSRLTEWKKDRSMYSAAWVSTLIWLSLMLLRLAVQLPLYFAGNVGALGAARLAMGTPLFALVILFTWLVFRKTLTPQKHID